jgi:hypothetical protein
MAQDEHRHRLDPPEERMPRGLCEECAGPAGYLCSICRRAYCGPHGCQRIGERGHHPCYPLPPPVVPSQ